MTGLRSLPRRQVVITLGGVMLAGDLGSLDREQIRRTEAQDAGKRPRDNTR